MEYGAEDVRPGRRGGRYDATQRDRSLLKTLHGYLTRDLIKVTLLSLVAFTLGLTVLAIVQPLRKQGLAGRQVLQLFVYTLPAMLSFTLPVATLFAATLVYGRFSQDNELLACRASGVSTLALLRPALGLGAIVTVLSLLLSNFLAPSATELAGLAKANVRGVLYHKLRSRGYLDVGSAGRKHIIHADIVDDDNDTLYGVVYAYVRKPKPAKKPGDKPRPGGALLASASAAYLDFVTDANGSACVVIRPVNPSVIQTGAKVAPPIAPAARTGQFVLTLPDPIREKPSWYSWHELRQAMADTTRHGEIGRELSRIKQLICNDLLARQITDTVADGNSYRGLAQGDETYEIEAAGAEVDDDGAAALTSVKADGSPGRRVRVVVRRKGGVREQVTADSGKVVVTWSALRRKPQVTVKLTDDVRATFTDATGRREHRPTEWARGEIPVPEEIRRHSDAIQLSDLRDPRRYTRNDKILRSIRRLVVKRIPHIKAGLMAELHARVAYGASCFLMVAMGAALGLIFRGGQSISAFAISAVPAAVVIALLVMGKEMVRNPDVSEATGLACIWGGIAALLAANVLIYLHLADK